MRDFQTVSFRLTPSLLSQIDATAANRGMTRSDWMRGAMLEILRDEMREETVVHMGKKLLARMDALQAHLTAHVTREIDTLTSS